MTVNRLFRVLRLRFKIPPSVENQTLKRRDRRRKLAKNAKKNSGYPSIIRYNLPQRIKGAPGPRKGIFPPVKT
jgi:hypothetical protein